MRRRRIILVTVYNARTLSPKGMAVTPWRKGKQYDLHPGGIIEPHKAGSGHSGDRPAGKKPKVNRVRTGPPGSPNGICTKIAASCRCGKHNERMQ